MRQEQELYRGAQADTPRRWNSIDTSGVLRGREASRERRLREIRFGLRQEKNKEGIEKESFQTPDGFDPFVDPNDPLKPPQQEGVLFVNCYNGNYAQRMELSRKAVGQTLKIAHLDGKVFLTSLQPSRSRAEAQGNELAAKRFLLFGEKPEKAKEENPLKRVVSVPEGWRIEINDQRITEELAERGLNGAKLQRAFINKFNAQVKEALGECVWREKLSSDKDGYFRGKLFWSAVMAISPFIISTTVNLALIKHPLVVLPFDSVIVLVGYGINNFRGELTRQRLRISESFLKELNPNFKPSSFSPHRNIDHPLEVFMPFVEIDKVARTFAYLTGKGRKLVREAKE